MTDLRSLFEMLGFHSEDWFKDALCAQTDPDMFFPGKGENTEPAKQVCAACPVRELCLQYALDHGEREGIWGGMSPQARRRSGQSRVCRTCGVSIAGFAPPERFCSPACSAVSRRAIQRAYDRKRKAG